MSEVKFKQNEFHQVSVRKVMVTSTTNWDGEEVISEEELRTFIAEGTTGDDEKDDICWNQINEAECIEEEDIDWWSERKGCTEYEYEVIDD